MHRSWIVVALIVLLLVFVVTWYGECLMNTAWGNVVINVISDFFFAVVLSVLLGILYQGMLAQARRFFGIDRQTPIQVYISTHEDKTTSTGKVMTTREYEVADELKSVLKKQFPKFIALWARLFGVDIDVPEIVIKGSPLEEGDTQSSLGSLILIGGPTRNKLTELYLKSDGPWVTFDDTKKKFIEQRGKEGESKELDNSKKLAILQKLIVNERVIIVAFGFGEIGTAAAVRYLAYEWKALARKYRDKPFAYLLLVDDLGQVRVQKEYS